MSACPARRGRPPLAIGVYLLVTGLLYDPFSFGVGHGWMNKFNAWTGRG